MTNQILIVQQMKYKEEKKKKMPKVNTFSDEHLLGFLYEKKFNFFIPPFIQKNFQI